MNWLANCEKRVLGMVEQILVLLVVSLARYMLYLCKNSPAPMMLSAGFLHALRHRLGYDSISSTGKRDMSRDFRCLCYMTHGCGRGDRNPHPHPPFANHVHSLHDPSSKPIAQTLLIPISEANAPTAPKSPQNHQRCSKHTSYPATRCAYQF